MKEIADLNKALKRYENRAVNIDNMLVFATEFHASDLYFIVGRRPTITRYGTLEKVPSYVLTRSQWNDWANIAVTAEQNTQYVREKMLDMSYVVNAKTDVTPWRPATPEEIGTKGVRELRYRVSLSYSNKQQLATFRMISTELPSFSKLDFPEDVRQHLKESSSKRNGILLIAGPTGSGKSTTMTASINDFTLPLGPMDNSTIISLEDPVEYIHEDNKPHVNIIQKELGIDFKSFDNGIKQSLREHPNFIVVGETRDKDTVKALIEASRTGHSVITSFHSSNVTDTISRIYNYLSLENPEIMYDLITQMNMILCQRIKSNGEKFDLETQYLVFTDQVIQFLMKGISSGSNISSLIRAIFNTPKMIESGIAKDWDN